MAHLPTGIEQAIVHIDIQHHSTVVHLLAGNLQRLFVLPLGNQPQELARPRHITPLPHIDKGLCRDG